MPRHLSLAAQGATLLQVRGNQFLREDVHIHIPEGLSAVKWGYQWQKKKKKIVHT